MDNEGVSSTSTDDTAAAELTRNLIRDVRAGRMSLEGAQEQLRRVGQPLSGPQMDREGQYAMSLASQAAKDDAADLAEKHRPPSPDPITLDAYRDGRDTLWIWCEHEQLWHRHGGGSCEHDQYPCACIGSYDGHRSAHCRCINSPHRAAGYVLREVGLLTPEIRAQHTDAAYLDGCRVGNCRTDREARAKQLQQPNLLPPPTDPLRVAHQVIKGYTDLRMADRLTPEDEGGMYERPLNAGSDDLALELDYSAELDGPLTLRRWRGSWWRWRRSRWSEIEDGELTSELYKLLGAATFEKVKPAPKGLDLGGAKLIKVEMPWTPNRRTVGEVAAALESISFTPTSVDAPGWIKYPGQVEVVAATDDTPAWVMGPPESGLVACTNGLLDPATRQLHDLNADWFNTTSIPFAYDADAPEPTAWLNFLSQLWPDDPDSIHALAEWFGYVLSGRTDLQKLMLLVGPPRSGKGTIVRVLHELVGRGNYAGPTLASLSTNFGLQPLLGKSLAVVADARMSGKDTHVIVERLLSISGEDSITVDRKFKDAVNARLPTRLMIVSNELPHFGDASGAIATRFVTLTLIRSWLGREDPRLEQRLKAELPGILLWALDGLERLVDRGRFTEPASSADAVIAMTDSASPTSAFVREWCQVGAGYAVGTKPLFAAWRNWCLENGRDHPGNEQTFGRTLRSVVPAVRITRPRDPETGRPTRMYEGIGLIRSDPRFSSLSGEISHPSAPGLWGPRGGN